MTGTSAHLLTFAATLLGTLLVAKLCLYLVKRWPSQLWGNWLVVGIASGIVSGLVAIPLQLLLHLTGDELSRAIFLPICMGMFLGGYIPAKVMERQVADAGRNASAVPDSESTGAA